MSYRKPLTSEMTLTDEQLKAVGCLTIESARLESLLSEFIQLVSRFSDEHKELFIGKWMANTKIDAIKTLVRPIMRSNIKLKRFDALFHKMKDSITRRNTIIHGEWAIPQPYNALAISLSGPDLRLGAVTVNKKKKLTIKATDVMTVALMISDCHYELFQLYREIALKRFRSSLNKSSRQYPQ